MTFCYMEGKTLRPMPETFSCTGSPCMGTTEDIEACCETPYQAPTTPSPGPQNAPISFSLTNEGKNEKTVVVTVDGNDHEYKIAAGAALPLSFTPVAQSYTIEVVSGVSKKSMIRFQSVTPKMNEITFATKWTKWKCGQNK